mmetsp:Transcript_12819/g.39622  ORF Transcript_12819/g.39622 Transcript_12819/m.39622 type:complete len:214 (+) Transcript_12819:24-665(+)
MRQAPQLQAPSSDVDLHRDPPDLARGLGVRDALQLVTHRRVLHRRCGVEATEHVANLGVQGALGAVGGEDLGDAFEHCLVGPDYALRGEPCKGRVAEVQYVAPGELRPVVLDGKAEGRIAVDGEHTYPMLLGIAQRRCKTGSLEDAPRENRDHVRDVVGVALQRPLGDHHACLHRLHQQALEHLAGADSLGVRLVAGNDHAPQPGGCAPGAAT